MKRVLQKLTSLTLATVMTLAPTIAHAEDREYRTLGAASVTCRASVSESFTVKLPVSLTLNNNQAASLPVSVKGNLVAGHSIKVVPRTTVQMQYMASNGTYTKDPVVATVTEGKTEWTSTELASGDYVADSATSVMVSGLSAGDWVGSLGYDISILNYNINGGTQVEEAHKSDNNINYSIIDGKYYIAATAANMIDLANRFSKLIVSGQQVDNDKIYYRVFTPSDMTTIQKDAFSDAFYTGREAGLTGTQISADHIIEINIDSGVTTIGENAFAGTSITKIHLYDAVATINKAPFANCTNLKEVIVDGAIDAYVDDTGTTFTKHVVDLGAKLNCNNGNNSYYVEGSETNLIKYIRADHNNMITDAIRKGVVTSLTLLGESTPTDVAGWDVTITDGVTVIPDYAFAYGDTGTERPIYYYNIVNVNIPDSVVTIGEGAFKNQKLKSIKLPNRLVTIGDAAFLGCTNLNGDEFDLVIPNSVANLGAMAFLGVDKMKSVNMKNTAVTNISDSTFNGCTALQQLTLPDGLLTIGTNALTGTTSLTSLIIPNTVTSINENAFQDSSLTSIYYSGTAEGSPWGASSASMYANNTI